MMAVDGVEEVDVAIVQYVEIILRVILSCTRQYSIRFDLTYITP